MALWPGGWIEEGWEMVSGGRLVYWVRWCLCGVGSSFEGSCLRMSAKSQFIGLEGVPSNEWEAKVAGKLHYLRERETEAARKLHYLSAIKFGQSLEGRQVDEAVSSIFHTVLFHRSLGKFRYKQEGSYSVGTIGYEDVDCDFIDFTYVCCSSVHLDRSLKGVINEFSEVLRGNDGPGTGQISLEFFQKKKNRWPFQTENIPWEVWTIRLELIKLNNEHERQVCREKVGDMLTDKIIYIAEVMNRHEYVPKMPNQSELDLIFDTTFPDVQPYLFKHPGVALKEPTSAKIQEMGVGVGGEGIPEIPTDDGITNRTGIFYNFWPFKCFSGNNYEEINQGHTLSLKKLYFSNVIIVMRYLYKAISYDASIDSFVLIVADVEFVSHVHLLFS
uniref:Autophagy-related protein 101 n=1 Tax=Timema shepardi TaxID=629360 RepID=A0A7R9AY70_TIMSH|nr:unnamed protein product [Timema shepardi]